MIRIVRTVISGVVEGVIKRFSGSGRKGEQFTGREYFQHYGFTSRPKPGAEGVAFIQGNTIYLVATDDRRYRISLEEGEVALYTDEGDFIHFRRGREINIGSGGRVLVEAAAEAEVNAPSVKVTCDTLEATASSLASVSAPQVSVAAASITVSPQAGGGGASAQITADIGIQGTLTLTGNLQVNGNIDTTGSITLTTGTVINAAGDVLHHH